MMTDEELSHFVKNERPGPHDCNMHLDIVDSEYPAWVNAVARKCRVCGHRYYNAVLPKKQDMFASLCPADYLDTQAHMLPSPMRLNKAMNWRFGARGLLLHGPSGTGKSRIAWKVMEREVRTKKSALALDFSISYDYSEKFGKSASDASKWITKHATIDLLLLDDVFKSRLSDGLEQAIFTIISMRIESKRPIIVTCNDVGETLMSRMSPDRGPALIRRLREYCDIIPFTN